MTLGAFGVQAVALMLNAPRLFDVVGEAREKQEAEEELKHAQLAKAAAEKAKAEKLEEMRRNADEERKARMAEVDARIKKRLMEEERIRANQQMVEESGNTV